MNTEHLQFTIEKLREMNEEKQDDRINSAVAYLELFLKKLNTHELPAERTPYGTLKRELIYPLHEYQGFEDMIWAKVRAELDIKMDDILSNFEKTYGLEPVTFREAEPYLQLNGFSFINCSYNDEQLRFKGYKIYKKKVN